MELLKNALLILLINSILFFQSVPVYAFQTDGVYSIPRSLPAEPERFSETAFNDRENTLVFEDVTLIIPAGAVTEDTTITMDKLYGTEFLNEGMANATQGAAAYRFGPDGFRFRKPIRIIIPFDRQIARSETTLSNLYTWFYSKEKKKWEKLERIDIDRENFTVTSLTDHFTDMINSTLQLPEGPSPIDFNPNSIKELKAADPGAGIPGISGLDASQTGGASFNIPLRIPRGRGSATPSLALSYSSESANSWMGRGFNISTPAITIDTRFGLPQYDGNDRYMYKGEELIPVSSNYDVTSYRPRKEGSFEEILRKSEPGEPDFWEISDKSGVVYTYGKSEAWLGPQRSDKSRIYTWYLSGIRDPNGNTVAYNYIYDSINTYTYPESIVYSGYDVTGLTETGKYKIEFLRENDPRLKRKDRRIDSRGKFPSKLVDLLKTIRVLYDGNLIRYYSFLYEPNEFGQTQLQSYSEYDKNGNEFYSYGFDYNKLPVKNDGYDGFGNRTIPWNAPFDNLTESISGSGGASLAVGISFRIFGKTIAGANVRGGYNYTGGMNRSLMTDIDGDGLPDFIETNSKNMGVYFNSGSGFENSFAPFDGLGSNLNVTGQNSVTVGAGVNVGPANASITGQFSWPFARTVLADFNGDGFIDQIEKDKDYFRMNTGASFVKVPLQFDNSGSAPAAPPSAEDLEEEDSYRRAFYREDPLIRWTSAASGTVNINQSIEAVSPAISKDGFEGRTYYKDRKESVKINQTGERVTNNYSFNVEEGDNLYFHLDSGEYEEGDDVDWINRISYSSIDLLENMDLISELDPPLHYSHSLPFPEISGLYSRSTRTDSEGDTYSYYTLKTDWKEFVNSSNYGKMYLYNLFIPRTVKLSQFLKMKDDPLFDPLLFLKGYDYHVLQGLFTRKNPLSDVQVKSRLNQWTDGEKLQCGSVLWVDGSLLNPVPSDPDEIIKSASRTLDSRLYGSDELAAPGRMDEAGNVFIESIETLHGSLDIIFDGSDANYPEDLTFSGSSDSVTLETSLEGYDYRVTLSGRNFLLDVISRDVFENEIRNLALGSRQASAADYRVISPQLYGLLINQLGSDGYSFYGDEYLTVSFYELPGESYIRLYSRLAPEEQILFSTLYRENLEKGTYDLNPSAADNEILSVLKIIHEYGEDEMFLMTGTEFNGINDYLLNHGYISDQFFSRLDDFDDGNSYFTVRNDLLPAQRDLLISILKELRMYGYFYRENGITGNYEFDSATGNAEKHAVLEILHELTDLPGTIFISGDCFFLMDDQEFSGLESFFLEKGADWETYLDYYPESEGLSGIFSLKDGLDETTAGQFISFLSNYLFIKETFPWYDDSGDVYTLKSSLTDGEKSTASDFFRTNNIFLWKNLSKTLTYSKGNRIPVETVEAAGGEGFHNLFTGFTTADAGQEIGRVSFPEMDSSGIVRERAVYIPVYNSEEDFSTASLIDYGPMDLDILDTAELEGETELPYYIDPFFGGFRNWAYGVWTGYYEWDESGLVNLYQDMFGKGDTEESDTPPIFTVPGKNFNEQLNRMQVDVIGEENLLPLETESIIGPVSSTNRTEIDDNGGSSVVSHDFCVVIEKGFMHPSRKGGNSYLTIPRSSGTAAGGTIPYLCESKSTSMDLSAGVSVVGLGGTIGSNTGDSWQYSNLLDLNGDRYPDLIKTSMNGSTSALVLLGTGTGFSPAVNTGLIYNRLSENSNYSLSFGGSASAGNGNQKYTFDDDGTVKTNTVDSTGKTGFSANGSIGVSINKTGFLDINGDGLIDQLHRSGTGNYGVGLNMGDLVFRSGNSWGNSFSQQFWGGSIFTGDMTRSSGLSYSSFGSFGGSLSIGYGIVGGSLGFTVNTNKTLSQLIDMNGDGLPDQVIKEDDKPYFLVRYNLGDTFSDSTVKLYRPEWAEYDLESLFLQDMSSIADNLSGTTVGGESLTGNAKQEFPDRSDNQFSEYGDPFNVDDTLSCSKGMSINLGGSVEFVIPITFLILSITPGINGTYAETSTSLTMMDINGDGLPDHVLKVPGQPLEVKLNDSLYTGLLKTVHLPSGGSYELDYGKVGNTVEMPQSRTVLKSVTRLDGFEDDGTEAIHKYTTEYGYENGYYDRWERLFYGFGRVKTTYGDDSLQTVNYFNRRYVNDTGRMNYYWRDLVSSKTLEDSQGNLIEEETYEYNPVLFGSLDPEKKICAMNLTAVNKEVFEVGSSDSLRSRMEYVYGDYGNIEAMKDLGILSDPDDDIYLSISYKNKNYFTGYLPSCPISLEVRDYDGYLFRQREGDYDRSGNLTQLTQHLNNRDISEYVLSYGKYGNLTQITGPRKQGYSGGAELKYEYDKQVGIYITSVSRGNSSREIEPYVSETVWDVALGVEEIISDINGNIQKKEYDSFGRLTEVRTPYDTGSIAAVSYEYNRESFPRYAVTYNKLRFEGNDDQVMKTAVLADGLGRVIETAREGEVYSSGTSRQGWILSGRIYYDGKGRPVQEGQSSFSPGPDIPAVAEMKKETIKTYDSRDRIRSITFPDKTFTRMDYSISGNNSIVTTIDPEGNRTVNATDLRGNIIRIVKSDRDENILTSSSYKYDILGDLLEASDHEDNNFLFTYDQMGRNLTVSSADTGLTSYAYDIAGNVIEKTDSKLRAAGEIIRYEYDGLNRLTKIDYPRMADTIMVYGEAGRNDNSSGRLISEVDESGTTVNEYGELGEVVSMTRTLNRLSAGSDPESAVMSYKSDYLGRMEEITYPDGEVVSYGYDSGGQVTTVAGKRLGVTTEYISKIGYDEFGQRNYIRYGNGIETTYEYDENRRWLSRLESTNNIGRDIQNINYRFDNVGNIEFLENDSELYKTTQTYVYDGLYQLTQADGVYESRPTGSLDYKSTYSQNFQYDSIGNMLKKNSSQFYSPARAGSGNLNYSLDYEYYRNKPHQAERIGNLWYIYDENGNVIEEREGGHSSPADGSGGAGLNNNDNLYWTDYGFGLFNSSGEEEESVYCREYTWDEENRLKESSDINETVNYLYDSSGERTAKYSSLGETLYFNSMWQETPEDDFNTRQSKHIYVGETRIASRLSYKDALTTGYEQVNTYYYHGDHLGSVNLVTDSHGDVYEHMEYTPYGEMWVEDKDEELDKIPFRFTGKEWDEETGLYYMSARYQNPMTSRWISADPAGAALVNPNRKGFNLIESLNWYSYVGNNPLKYTDPTGMYIPVEDNGSAYEPPPSFGSADAAYSGTQASIIRDKDLNQGVVDNALPFVGSGYLLGGNTPTTEGGAGIDCSETPQLAAERASGVTIRDRTADEMYRDPNLMKDGSGGAGSVNFFDLDGDGHIDHATIVTGQGTEIHPSSRTGTINLVDEGSIDQYAEAVYNKEFNWDYILGD